MSSSFCRAFGYPSYLSFRVYAKAELHADLYVDDRRAYGKHAEVDPTGTFGGVVPVQAWVHGETGAYLPPDALALRAFHRRLCMGDRAPPLMILHGVDAPTEYHRCEELP